MQVIPVLDLKGGRAVHARRGDRANYRPLDIAGCRDGNPLAAVDAYRFIHPFQTLYIADLDAIAGGPGHDKDIASIGRNAPELSLIVDNGIHDASAMRQWTSLGIGVPVIGSETMPPPHLARDFGVPLSLDFRADGFRGPAGLDSSPDDWPDTVIVMTLARVGSGEGPDLERLAAIRSIAGNRQIYAAGGIRHGADMKDLKALGIDAVLVATCLHNGSVGAAEIEAVAD